RPLRSRRRLRSLPASVGVVGGRLRLLRRPARLQRLRQRHRNARMPTGPVSLPKRFLVGANYWSRAGGPRMWERFDEAMVKAELAALKAAGLDCLRVFAFAPTMMPRPPAVDDARLAAMARFATLAHEAGLAIFPTPLVGHMSGENFDFPAQGGRSLYADGELRAWQIALVRGVVGALRDHPAVAGWILSNEMPLWGGASWIGSAPGSDAGAIVDWARAMLQAVRDGDGARPVGTGDGMMASWPVRALAGDVDWVGPHVYYGDADPLRQAWNVDFVLRRAQALGKPVLLEEFGASSTQAGEAEHAAYVRESMLSAFGLGAAGAMVWCASDFDA